ARLRSPPLSHPASLPPSSYPSPPRPPRYPSPPPPSRLGSVPAPQPTPVSPGASRQSRGDQPVQYLAERQAGSVHHPRVAAVRGHAGHGVHLVQHELAVALQEQVHPCEPAAAEGAVEGLRRLDHTGALLVAHLGGHEGGGALGAGLRVVLLVAAEEAVPQGALVA